MIPILLQGTTVRGFLPDALSCVVTEERNGIYELTMAYPVTAPMFSELTVDRFIKAKPNDTASNQLFRIYEITKPINGIVTVNAEHISYALSHFPVSSVSITGTATQSINAVLSNANSNLASTHGFSVATTDMTAVRAFSAKACSARAALGGISGSVLDTFGGEYEFDNKVIRLHSHRSSDTGVIVAYGKNLTDLKLTTSMENSYTALFPYCLKDDVLTILPERRISVTNNSGISQRVLLKDFTSSFGNGEEITQIALRDKADAWLADNDINSPTINLTVSFIHLWQSPEYTSLAALEKVSLCDYVTVRHSVLGIDVKVQVIKTVYDTLGERYTKIELGSAKANFADTLRQTTQTLQDAINAVEGVNVSAITEAYLQAIEDATNAITGNSGGFVVLNPAENPQELLVMNTADKNTATKVWRWNVSGLGYSSNGYNGTYGTAITMNGAINADFITAGTLTANVIRAGILSSADGTSYFNLESGLIHTENAEIVGGSIQIGGDDYYTSIANGSLSQYSQSSGGLVGGLVPVSFSGSFAQMLYCSNNVNGVCISKRNRYGTFDTIAQFNTDTTEFYSDVLFDGEIRSHIVPASGFGYDLYCGYNTSNTVLQYYNGCVCIGVTGQNLKVYASSLLPFNGSVSLGSSSSRWNGLYTSGTLDCCDVDCESINTNGWSITCGSIACNSDITCHEIYTKYIEQCEAINLNIGSSSTATVIQMYNGAVAFGVQSKKLTLWGSEIEPQSDMYPSINSAFDIGSNSKRWYNGYFANDIYIRGRSVAAALGF